MPSSLDSVLLINVNLSIFLNVGNRTVLSLWWSLNYWTKSYKINNVQWQSPELLKYPGVAKYRNKNGNRVILEKPLKEISLALDLKKLRKYFGLAKMERIHIRYSWEISLQIIERVWRIVNVRTEENHIQRKNARPIGSFP